MSYNIRSESFIELQGIFFGTTAIITRLSRVFELNVTQKPIVWCNTFFECSISPNSSDIFSYEDDEALDSANKDINIFPHDISISSTTSCDLYVTDKCILRMLSRSLLYHSILLRPIVIPLRYRFIHSNYVRIIGWSRNAKNIRKAAIRLTRIISILHYCLAPAIRHR